MTMLKKKAQLGELLARPEEMPLMKSAYFRGEMLHNLKTEPGTAAGGRPGIL